MSKHAPYYSVSHATDRGARFGGAVGMALGIATLAFPGFFAGTMLAPLIGMAGGIVVVPLVGALAGMAVGAPLFAATNMVTHIVPGLSHALGEDKAPTHLEDRHRAIRSGQYTNVTTPDDYAKMTEHESVASKEAKVERDRLQQMRLSGIS